MGWNFFTSSGEIKRVSKSASTVSETAPPNPANGDLWTNASNMVTYVYYSDGSSSQWVEAANNARPTTMYGTVANRPTASTTGLYYYATDTKQVFIDSGSAWVEVTKPTYETSLPASPYDGQEIYYAADATNGIIWHLRYRSGSSSSYKWEYVGGPSLVAESGTVFTKTGTNAYGDPSTGGAGPSITVPLAGEYRITTGYRAYNTTGDYHGAGFQVGTAAIVEAVQTNPGANTNTYLLKEQNGTVTAANTAVVYKVRNANPATTTTGDMRALIVRPVRVG